MRRPASRRPPTPRLGRRGRLALLAALLGWAAPSVAAAAATAVVPEISFDAGEVRLGAEVTHDFVVRNAGDSPLHLTEVTPSCGCTVADFDGTIAPGREGRIKVRIKTGELSPGPTSKTVSVATDAAVGERFVLQIKLMLAGALEFLPFNPVYLVAHRGRAEERRVLLRVREQGLQIRGVSSSSPLVRATLVAATPGDDDGADGGPSVNPASGDYWIVVAVQPTAPAGRLRAAVTVQTSDPAAAPNVLKIEAVVR